VSLFSFVSPQAKKQRQNRPIPQVSPAQKRSHSSSALADASRCAFVKAVAHSVVHSVPCALSL
jgi:hypothetical protein